MNRDQQIADICIASIRRHSMDPETWKYTFIGQLHPVLESKDFLKKDELPLVSCYFAESSWYVITTRRIVGIYFGCQINIEALLITENHSGNFKGYGNQEREVFTVRTNATPESRFEYETGKASMAPIYALRTLIPKTNKGVSP